MISHRKLTTFAMSVLAALVSGAVVSASTLYLPFSHMTSIKEIPAVAYYRTSKPKPNGNIMVTEESSADKTENNIEKPSIGRTGAKPSGLKVAKEPGSNGKQHENNTKANDQIAYPIPPDASRTMGNSNQQTAETAQSPVASPDPQVPADQNPVGTLTRAASTSTTSSNPVTAIVKKEIPKVSIVPTPLNTGSVTAPLSNTQNSITEILSDGVSSIGSSLLSPITNLLRRL